MLKIHFQHDNDAVTASSKSPKTGSSIAHFKRLSEFEDGLT
jgi:hypothetical protein